MNLNEASGRFDSLRAMAIVPLSFFALASIGLVAVIGLVEPEGSPGIFELIITVLIVGNLSYFMMSGRVRNASQALVLLIGAFLSGGLYTETIGRIGEYWLIVFPVIAMLFLGRFVASVFVGFFVASMLPALVIGGSWDLPYTSTQIAGVILGVVLVSAFLYYYDYLLGKSLVQEAKDMDTAVDPEASLKLEVAQRQNAEAQMTEAVRKLEENNAKLEQATAIDQATISSIGEAVLIVDPDGKIARANPSAGRVLGVNQEELIGNHIVGSLSFSSKEDETVVLSEEKLAISQSMAHRSINEETYKITRPDGSTLYARMTASPLVVGGEVYGAVVVVRDATEEVVVDQTKSEFVSIASHQLRTPLSTINWYLEMVLAGDFGQLNDEQSEFIQEAYDAGKRMGDLINALLNASRLDVGVVAVEPQDDIDIRTVLKGVMTDLEARITAKKIHSEIQIDESVVPMSLDTRIMEIIFLNLLTNAVKYSPAGSDIFVAATTDEDSLVITVTDRGYGIPASVQDKIFTKMFRADNAVEHEPDGNGLGLYIIKEILDTIGGSISFISKEGEGTSFTVRIPKTGMQPREGAKQLSLDPSLN